MNNILNSYISLQLVLIIVIMIMIMIIIMIIIKEVRSGEETSRNPWANTERPPRRCVRAVRLVRTKY